MTQQSRLGYAKLSTDPQRLHVPSRKLPVIIVPDLFGTRLSDTDSTGLEIDLTWNPRGYPFTGDHPSPGPFVADMERLEQISNPLDPDTKHKFEKTSDRNKVLHITNYYNMVPEWYHEMATQIADMGTDPSTGSAVMQKYRIYPRVYIAGYDWRQDNARSALRLASVVDQAVRETGSQQVVIIGHGMGGSVALYYSRCLGGENRIQRLILVGTGLLGFPDAYSQLKNGLGGVYAKAYRDSIENMTKHPGCSWDNGGREMLTDGISDALSLTDAAISATSPADFADRFFGGLYLKLCIGAGKTLSRDDTRTFVRHLPAMYQLLPNATYCRAHWNWLLFDPSATGYPASGYMLITPTLLELLPAAIMSAAGGMNFDQATGKVSDLILGKAKDRSSTRAKRNSDTLITFFRDVFGKEGVASDDDDVSESAINKLQGFFDRFNAVFLDCRNPRNLYLDICTGFTDVVDQRALCAGNLALARRFDDALTVKARPELPASGKTLVRLLMKGASSWLLDVPQKRTDALNKKMRDNGVDSPPPQLSDQDKKDLVQLDKTSATKEDWDEEFRQPRIYMHPDTVAIYGEGIRCPHPGILLPTRVVSNDDSNVVLWKLIPNLLDLKGDGMVTTESANPEPSPPPPPASSPGPAAPAPPAKATQWLNRPFKYHKAVQKVDHRDLCANPEVIAHVKKALNGAVQVLAGDVEDKPA